MAGAEVCKNFAAAVLSTKSSESGKISCHASKASSCSSACTATSPFSTSLFNFAIIFSIAFSE